MCAVLATTHAASGLRSSCRLVASILVLASCISGHTHLRNGGSSGVRDREGRATAAVSQIVINHHKKKLGIYNETSGTTSSKVLKHLLPAKDSTKADDDDEPKNKLEVPPSRPWPNTKVLVYTAAKFDDKVYQLTVENVKHLKKTGLQFDLLLGHYDSDKDKWIDRDLDWYADNVRWGVKAKGFKVHLLASIVSDGLAEGLNIDDYDWVWMLDEDIDVTRIRPELFVPSLTRSGAVIVGPAFYQLRKNTSVAVNADNPRAVIPSLLEEPYYPMNTPQWDKNFRYVPLVEIIMPFVRPIALNAFFSCKDCLAPFASDWGIDHIWCASTARHLNVDRKKVCAIVDHSGPIYHLNFGSTRTTDMVDGLRSEGQKAVRWAKKHHPRQYQAQHLHSTSKFEGYGSEQFNYVQQ